MYDKKIAVRKNREYMRLHHFCRECQKVDAYTLNGHPKCYECMQKENEMKRKKRKENKIEYNQYQRNRREKLKLELKCSVCGINLPENYSYFLCEKCRWDKKLKKRKRDQQKVNNWPRGDNGICYQCNKKPVINGKRLCTDCYSMKMKFLEKAMERNRELKNEGSKK